MSKMFKKVLVANRGEIAMRIFRACHDLGLQTIAIYSNEDTYSLFRTAADESYLIGKNESPLGAYLNIPRIIELAKKHGADAIHPGYGFLSENGDFARACEEAGIQFIGPSSKILDMMGDKLSAKQMAVECGVPTTPGTTEPLKSRQEAQKLAMEFGFPVILKAAAGGGGRGMRRCDTVEEVGINYDLVKAEAKKAFGNDDIFMEKFLVEPKHIEVQILGDEFGNVVMPKDITDVWMNEAELLDLFGVTVPTIWAGIKALCKSGKLREYGIRRTIRISDNCSMEAYNLETIIALAFRIGTFGAEQVRNAILKRLYLRKEKQTVFFSLNMSRTNGIPLS